MGAMIDSAILNQLRQAQGETNQRLDALLAAQQRTNQLLEWGFQLVATAVDAKKAPAEAGA